MDFCFRETFPQCIQEGEAMNDVTEGARFHDKNLIGLHYCQWLSLRLGRNPAGFSKRFPTSGNDNFTMASLEAISK
jgi:hypothetical protein